MKRPIFLIIAAVSLLAACQSGSKEDECTSEECLKQQAYDRVIALHDEVMPKLGEISELQRKLEEKMKNGGDSVTIGKYIAMMQQLDRADDSMWTWMRAFNSDIEPLPIDEALDYLKSEEEKIAKVAENIKASITEANKLLIE